MALRTSRPQSILQDENAQVNMISGKLQLHERKGLQPQQQQQAPMERRTLSNITNHVLSQPKLTNKPTAEKESFAVLADVQEAVLLPTAKKPSRPPLKNISNGTPNLINSCSSKPLLKPKSEQKIQSQNSAFQLPPRSKLNITEDMKKKAALWAEEGIEKVHFTGEDMEKLHILMRDREIAKRVAMTRNCRTDLSFPIFSVPCSPDVNSSWRPPGDVLEMDVIQDLSDDDVPYEKEDQSAKIIDEVLGCIDDFSIWSPPRLTEGWPKVKGEVEVKINNE